MPLIGYARVSTEEQVTDAQTDVLKAAGCVEIFREHMSGAKASRPELAKALSRVRAGSLIGVSTACYNPDKDADLTGGRQIVGLLHRALVSGDIE